MQGGICACAIKLTNHKESALLLFHPIDWVLISSYELFSRFGKRKKFEMLLNTSLPEVTSLWDINSHFRMKWTLLSMFSLRQVHLHLMIISDMNMLVANLSKCACHTESDFWFNITNFAGFSDMQQKKFRIMSLINFTINESPLFVWLNWFACRDIDIKLINVTSKNT